MEKIQKRVLLPDRALAECDFNADLLSALLLKPLERAGCTKYFYSPSLQGTIFYVDEIPDVPLLQTVWVELENPLGVDNNA